jgi:hypothetical protein
MAEADFTPQATLEEKLRNLENDAWNLHNIMSFMAEALPEDTNESLPVRCTLFHLRELTASLASKLGDEAHQQWSLQRKDA